MVKQKYVVEETFKVAMSSLDYKIESVKKSVEELREDIRTLKCNELEHLRKDIRNLLIAVSAILGAVGLWQLLGVL